jgi:ubiquinol-cytochrome c reductase iron-sulfur subunit
MLGGARLVYASAARLALLKVIPILLIYINLLILDICLQFVASMSATADVLALASAEFDTSSIMEGTTLTVKWRGKPVFIRHRTEAEINRESIADVASLKDPQPDSVRTKDPKWYL